MTMKKVLTISGILLVLATFIELIFAHPHGTYWWHNLVAFDIVFGFFGCLLLIVVAKGLGNFLQQPENYYGGGDDSDD
ncbi:MAG: hypothetical protein GXY91_02660 [Clostridia bacterium]|nr:hypothetical protein [Clostridia bacterium]